MKKAIFLFLIMLTANSIFSQTYFVKNDTYDKSQFIDYTENKINLVLENDIISGNFIEVRLKKDYENRLFVSDNENTYILHLKGRSEVKNVIKLGAVEAYDDLIKYLEKDKLNRKVNVLRNKDVEIKLSSESFFNMMKKNYDAKIILQEKKQDAIKNFETSTGLLNYVGTYEIKIMRVDNTDFSIYDTGSKLFITEVGITVKSNGLTMIDNTRAVYNKTLKAEKGIFNLDVLKNEGSFMVLVIDENKSAGSFTIKSGSIQTTCTFIITKFIN
jgi:hypothetical protein